MSSIEANVTIRVTENIDVQQVIRLLQTTLSQITGQDTRVNVVEVDDPASMSPLNR